MLFPVRLVSLLTFALVARASTLTTILAAIEATTDCTSCLSLLTTLQSVAQQGDAVFTTALITLCQASKAEDNDVCQGFLSEQGPILAHDLRSISGVGQSATKFCNAILGLCDAPAVNAYTVPFPKAAPAKPKVFSSCGRTPFQVVHFSDVHIDRIYTPGSEQNCTKPICCRTYADQDGVVDVPAGQIGSHSCDTSAALTHSMLNAVQSQKPLFSIFTGDIVEAAVWLVNQSEVTSDLLTFDEEMASFLGSPVFPVIGNHDVAPVSSFPRSTTTQNSSDSQWAFDTQSQAWAPLIGWTAATQAQHTSGSYAEVVSGTNLRIISLNTIYWYKDNFWLYDSDTFQPDPNGILAFAVQQLQAAEDAGQRAWIIAHMPPSSGDAFHDQSNYFDQIVQRYQNTIAAQFYGHSHVDEFAIAYSDYTNQNAATANSISYIAPSLTPRAANPAFRIYDVDPDTYEVMDSRTFFSNMTKPSFQVSPVWELEYSARATYGPAIGGWPATQSLNAAFWHKVTAAFASNAALFQTFNSFKTRGAEVVACTGTCVTTEICNLRAARAENNCNVPTPGFNYRRDVEEDGASTRQRGFANHCEGTGIRSIFTNVAANAQSIKARTLAERANGEKMSI